MDYRKMGLGRAGFAVGATAWVVGVGRFGPKPGGRAPSAGNAGRSSGGSTTGTGHVPTDLMGDHHPAPGDRAPEAFRPDPTAVPTAEEREALRPATGPAPTLVADRGSGFTEATGAA